MPADDEIAADASCLWYLLPLFSVAFLYAAPGLLLWHLQRQTVRQILMGLFLLAVVNGLAALYHGWQRRSAFLERAAMLMKYGLIPFYFALFIAAMVSGDFAMGVTRLWGTAFAVSAWDVVGAVAALALLAGTGYVLAAIETAPCNLFPSPISLILFGSWLFVKNAAVSSPWLRCCCFSPRSAPPEPWPCGF